MHKDTRHYKVSYKKICKYIDYKKREKTGNLTTVERLLKMDIEAIENSKREYIENIDDKDTIYIREIE
ncbi:hypothetical protein [Faecalimicrobium dakarense]|uniref:hypothetical protein n=1 Tax=Faecalimicrobium dakarense TaxID=1301100 RepID=UPI0004B4B4AF|nr:hypothetical protein [[Clostridium] dakarense]